VNTVPARTRARTRAPRSKARRAGRRRLLAVGAMAVVATAVLVVAAGRPIDDALREVTLPLRHDDIIRQQAADKDLDAALIASVIYHESKFRDQTSHAGARGLMQITPETAEFIAHRSGGIRFVQEDLATPQVNIAYGSWYLRYLLDRYGGNETLAIAAYNAGHSNVDEWVAAAGGAEGFDAGSDIPFPETREYVANVLEDRNAYRDHYADDLGL
jgi:soluble lytic murein transglycosylase